MTVIFIFVRILQISAIQVTQGFLMPFSSLSPLTPARSSFMIIPSSSLSPSSSSLLASSPFSCLHSFEITMKSAFTNKRRRYGRLPPQKSSHRSASLSSSSSSLSLFLTSSRASSSYLESSSSSVDIDIVSNSDDEGDENVARGASNVGKSNNSSSSISSKNNDEKKGNDRNIVPSVASLLRWDDLPLLLGYTMACLTCAAIFSTYEDYDVTFVRPSPSTLRHTISSPNSFPSVSSLKGPWSSAFSSFDFIGAATRGMGWGRSDRRGDMLIKNNMEIMSNDASNSDDNANEYGGDDGNINIGNENKGRYGDGNDLFQQWYGESAATLQWKPSYNEIMLYHRNQRVPRWKNQQIFPLQPFSSPLSSSLLKTDQQLKLKEQKQEHISNQMLKVAATQIYQGIEEINQLKLMSDDYMWEEIKERLQPLNSRQSSSPSSSLSSSLPSLPMILEYSLDVLRMSPTNYNYFDYGHSNDDLSSVDKKYMQQYQKQETMQLRKQQQKREQFIELSQTIGFDWGSCAWRHCGAKADAQEAIAELYSSIGMLEPFECQFILDVIERSLRDVIAVIPEELQPDQEIRMQLKTYIPYESQAEKAEEGIGIDYDYVRALSDLRVDLSEE